MRIAVLGLGFMGSTHIQAWRTVPGVQLAAVYSSDEKKLAGDLSGIQGNLGGQSGKHDFSQLARYRDVRALLADKSIDAVDLCLPTHLHEETAIEAVRAGKHVLVEKPIALEASGGEKMIGAARKHDRVLMAAQVLRFFPQYEALIALQRSQELGPLRAMTFGRRCASPTWNEWLKDARKSGGGVFDLLIHDVDMAVHLFGSPVAVSATGYEDLDRGIDLITGHLHCDDVPSVVIEGGWHHPQAYPFTAEYAAVFDEGTLDFRLGVRPPTLFRRNGQSTVLSLADQDGFAAELAYFAECCRDNKEPERCRPEESVEAVRVMRCLLQARQQGGTLISCRN